MGFLDKVYSLGKSGDGDEKAKNIGKIASENAIGMVKQLSGNNEASTRQKVVDNLIMFTNGQGGTGASTVAANVAQAMADKGFKVLLIDLNIICPCQQMYFTVKQEQEKPDLVSYLMGEDKLGDCIENAGKVGLMYANNRNLMDSMNCEEDLAVANFTNMLDDLRGLFDVVIMDCPMRIDNTLCNTAMYVCDAIYMVWDDGATCISNTERIRRNLALTGIDAYTKMRVVINKRTSQQYTRYPFEKLNLELVEILPFESDIIYSGFKGEIFIDKGVSKTENSKVFCKNIQSLAMKILQIGGYVGK